MKTIEQAFWHATRALGIGKATKVVIGFSGGPDSLALALLCAQFGIQGVLAHLDHGIREDSAQEDTQLAAFADSLGFAYATRRVDIPKMSSKLGIGVEDAGRRARAAFLEEMRTAFGCQWIFLGHQADDLAEDVLLRLVRGAAWPAVSGMVAVDTARHLARPLLAVSRADIEAYATFRHAVAVDDATNATDAYRRNRIRHHVIPALKAENPAFLQTIQRLWKQARDDEAFWDDYLNPVVRQISRAAGTICLPEKAVRVLPAAARTRILARLLKTAGIAVRFDAVQQVDAALLRPQRPKRIQFSGGTCVLNEGKIAVLIAKPRQAEQPDERLADERQL